MTGARLDDRALLDFLAWDDAAAAGDRLANMLDPDGQSLAHRDAALLRLHLDRFGPELVGAVDCPACGDQLELRLAIADVLPAALPEHALRVEHDGFDVQFRLPARDDLLAADDERGLAERCVVTARRVVDGAAVPASALPASVLAAMGDAMALTHPAAALHVAGACPACGAVSTASLDVGAFVAARVRVDALRLIDEVDALARAYGWTEDDVLAVPRSRRRRYLGLVLA
jgi:hypothetical protein